MPPSMSGYGQDSSGVNVQNKRALMRNGDSTTPHDWKSNTVEELVLADKYKIMSVTTRQHARNLQDMSTMQMQRDNELVEEALNSKLHKTEAMANLLGKTIEDVSAEIAKLEHNRNRLFALINQTEQKMVLNDKRMQVRSQRPSREMVNDDVQAQLHNNATLLRGTMDKLHRCLRSTEVDISRLQESKVNLAMDLQNKESALAVDTEVLNDELGENSRAGMRKSTLYPHSWNKSTDELVRTARQWQSDSLRLRGAIENVYRDARQNERAMRQGLHVSALGKLAETQQLKNVLSMQKAETEVELEAAHEAKESLEMQLLDLDANMSKTKSQYIHRTQRPDQEKVVDEAETALLKTITNQKAMKSSLLDRRQTVTTKISQLESALSKLHANIADKEHCIKVDSKAIMLDGRKEVDCPPSVASLACSSLVSSPKSGSPCSPGGSKASSTRESIMSRLSQLEEDLRKTKESNESLEKGIKEYQAMASGSE